MQDIKQATTLRPPYREAIEAEILAQAVEGVNLAGPTFGDNLDGQGPTLLVFLRHLG